MTVYMRACSGSWPVAVTWWLTHFPVHPLDELLRPVRASQLLRINEQRRDFVGAIHALLVPNPGHVVRHIGHAGVLDDQTVYAGQREVRVPDSMPASVVDECGLLVEE